MERLIEQAKVDPELADTKALLERAGAAPVVLPSKDQVRARVAARAAAGGSVPGWGMIAGVVALASLIGAAWSLRGGAPAPAPDPVVVVPEVRSSTENSVAEEPPAPILDEAQIEPAPNLPSAPPPPSSRSRRSRPAQPTPPVTAPPASSAPEVMVAAPVGDGSELVLEAMRVLRVEHNPELAAPLLERYLEEHPDGSLAEEALALAIQANAGAAPDRAAAYARRYLSRFPGGRFNHLAEEHSRLGSGDQE